MRLHRIVVGTGACLVALCATAGGRVTIVSEQDTAASWTLAPDAPRVVAGYPSAAADHAQDVCVNIGYMIEKDGKTSNFIQLKAWSSAAGKDAPAQESIQPFVQSAAAAVSMWRFVPVNPKAHSIYTSASFGFAGSKTLDEAAIRDRCRIEDLPALVAQAQAKQNRQMSDAQRSTSQRMASGY